MLGEPLVVKTGVGGGNLVVTPQGSIKGVAFGDTYKVFYGIPFAQPPTGELRWRSPVNAKAWAPGILRAFYPAVNCAGNPANVLASSGQESEDCLYLNVWAPVLAPTTMLAPGSRATAKRPVIVFLHGGGYESGGTTGNLYTFGDPKYGSVCLPPPASTVSLAVCVCVPVPRPHTPCVTSFWRPFLHSGAIQSSHGHAHSTCRRWPSCFSSTKLFLVHHLFLVHVHQHLTCACRTAPVDYRWSTSTTACCTAPVDYRWSATTTAKLCAAAVWSSPHRIHRSLWRFPLQAFRAPA